MVKHLVFWKLHPEADGRSAEANALEMKQRLEALKGQIDELVELEVGIDVSRSPASADVALYSTFKNLADLQSYQQHPAHQALVKLVGTVTAERFLVDYEV
jgi:quinol monooxygenase YgiN